MTAPWITEESTGIADDPELLLAESDVVSIDVEVDGVPVDPNWTAVPTECFHSSQVNVETVVAFIKDDPDDRAAPAAEWQLRVRALCGECGQAFVIAPTGRVPKGGGPGVVLAMVPIRPPDDPTT